MIFLRSLHHIRWRDGMGLAVQVLSSMTSCSVDRNEYGENVEFSNFFKFLIGIWLMFPDCC